MRNKLQQFFYGRNGNDALTFFSLGVYFVFHLLGQWLNMSLLAMVGSRALFYGLYRILSRNLTMRREENARFLQATKPIVAWARLRSAIHKDKEHNYFKCPSCSQQLRVPKGKGRLNITCRNCGVSFQKNS